MINKHSLYDIILSPVMSEKSNNLNSLDKYVFFVNRKSSKGVIARAVEYIFNVKVESVNVVNLKRRKVVFKGVRGVQPAKKKAIVTLRSGDKIELMDIDKGII